MITRRLAAVNTTENDLITAADYKTLAGLAIERGKPQLAERCYRKIIALDPQNTHIHYELGILLFNAKHYSDAISEFLLYRKNDVVVSEVYIYLAYAYFMIKDLTTAEGYARKSVEIAPTSPYAYFVSGLVAQSQEAYQQAQEYYEKALALDADFQEARENLEQIQPYL